jgi:hypothetical protein
MLGRLQPHLAKASPDSGRKKARKIIALCPAKLKHMLGNVAYLTELSAETVAPLPAPRPRKENRQGSQNRVVTAPRAASLSESRSLSSASATPSSARKKPMLFRASILELTQQLDHPDLALQLKTHIDHCHEGNIAEI